MSTQSTVVFISGANSGIGLATAQVIARASPDYHVIIGSRSLANGEKAVADIRASGAKGTLSAIELDVTDSKTIDAAVKHVQETFGRLDALVNNAGVFSQNPDINGQLEETFVVNCTGSVLMTEAFESLLLQSTKAYLLHISSALGSFAIASQPGVFSHKVMYLSYRMSKAALNMMTLQHAIHLGEKGIKVFAVCPGLVESNLRGKDEASRKAGGRAGDPLESGRLMLDIIQGGRESDVGKFVCKDGVYGW